MRGQEADHVISGPIIGLKKTASEWPKQKTDKLTSGYGDSMTESAQWGKFSKIGNGKYDIETSSNTSIYIYKHKWKRINFIIHLLKFGAVEHFTKTLH